jgi:hypothetical protein
MEEGCCHHKHTSSGEKAQQSQVRRRKAKQLKSREHRMRAMWGPTLLGT